MISNGWITDALSTAVGAMTIKAMLVDSGFAADPDATAVPTGDEISGTGYTAGGEDVTSLASLAYNSGSNQIRLALSGPVNFGPVVASDVSAIVFYDDTGSVMLLADVFDSVAPDGSEDFVYTPAAGGIMAVQVS
jgi:hypothetical protein